MAEPVTVKTDRHLIDDAARALGIYEPEQTAGRTLTLLLQTVAGSRPRSPIADGGAPAKRAGRVWEALVVEHGQDAGFSWDRGPLRGRRDLLDVTGCLPDGWLIGAKGVQRGVSAAVKLHEAMDQNERAMENLAKARTLVSIDDVIPVQVIQRPGSSIGAAYAVTEYDDFLRLAKMRKEWGKKK